MVGGVGAVSVACVEGAAGVVGEVGEAGVVSGVGVVNVAGMDEVMVGEKLIRGEELAPVPLKFVWEEMKRGLVVWEAPQEVPLPRSIHCTIRGHLQAHTTQGVAFGGIQL